MQIRQAGAEDHDAIWAILEPIFRAGETYCIAQDISKADALNDWFGSADQVFVAVVDDEIAGTFQLGPNRAGGGNHVANAGFATAPQAAGKGIARAMLEFAENEARRQSFRAMQFNFVIANNHRAVATWEKSGYDIVGRLPGAFSHPKEGYVDALVMYKAL